MSRLTLGILPSQEQRIEGFQLKVARQLAQEIEANMHAAFVCKTYFVSHAWMKVGFPRPHTCLSCPLSALACPCPARACLSCLCNAGYRFWP